MNTQAEKSYASLQDYLKALNHDELDELLDEVLEEIRARESEQVKADVLRHSQQLRLNRFRRKVDNSS